MLFDGWSGLLRILVVGSLAYCSLVLFLRVSGKRTLTKLNAFDLVVTVALGSTLSSALLTSDVSLAEGAAGLGLLILLQLAVAWVSVRVPPLRRAFKSEPTLLLSRGRFLGDALRRERVAREEVRQAVRSQGQGGLDGIEAVVLETDGSMSVITRANAGGGEALDDVARE
jgi:uncharacterized membrane protein YcaP (DUF421 family)